MPIYEYQIVVGEKDLDGRHYPVDEDEINREAKKGWRFVAFRNRESQALMEREIPSITHCTSDKEKKR